MVSATLWIEGLKSGGDPQAVSFGYSLTSFYAQKAAHTRTVASGIPASRLGFPQNQPTIHSMTLRYQPRIKILPGLHLNLSKSGVGFSAGLRGFHIGIDSRKRPYVSSGIPGTGLSWREYPGHSKPADVSDRGGCLLLVLFIVILIAIMAVVGKQ